MAYTTTIACCQKWFPDKRGLATGIIVAAPRVRRACVHTPVAEALLAAYGVLITFSILGVVFFIVNVAGAFCIINPPENYRPAGWTPPAKSGSAVRSFTPSEAGETPQFYMVIGFAFSCARPPQDR